MKLVLKYDNNKKIYSFIRNKYLETTPEEIVRQEFVCKLINEYGYSLEQMEEEKNLTENSDRGTWKASADILVYKSEKDKLDWNNAFMVVECKAEQIKLTEKDYFQGANYARWSWASVLVVTNSKDNRYFEILPDKLPFSKRKISNIPHFSIINNSEKLKEELTKTTTMTRDDFVKLLLKCHNIIRNNDKLSPEAAFDEISKILFMKIRYERSQKDKIFSLDYYKKAREYHIENWNTNPLYQQLFELTKKEFEKDNLFEKNEILKIRENSFEAILRELQIYDLSNTSDDVKWIAFEKFLWRTFRGELGQFFTPRTIVNFMVEVLDPQEWELICDPACGSWGFLIKAFEYIRDQIQDDIERQKEEIQKKYFWEAPNIKNLNEITEEQKKQLDEFQEKINDKDLIEKSEKEIKKLEKQLELSKDRETVNTRIDKLSKTCIFGTDANPRMARVSKMNMIMHGDGHGWVHHNDWLLNVNWIFENRFDVILANPPFGSRVPKDLKIEEADKYKDEAKKEYYIKKYWEEYERALEQVEWNIGKKLVGLYDTWKFSTLTEVLFMERNLRLLKKWWRMWIVLPEWVLNNSNLQKVRDYFEWKAKILLITSIPQDVFIASWATVKPSLVFLKKFTEEEEQLYKTISEKAKKKIKLEFKEELQGLEKKAKNMKDKEEKKKLIGNLKDLRLRVEDKIKKRIKEEFNYTVPIAEVEKAWISTTWKEIENELVPLVEEFSKYRKQNNLW